MDLGIEGLGEATWIGAGASATVYRAQQGRLARDVAVKVLTERDPAFVRRFEREARMLGQLSQKPGIVTVYDTGVTTRGEPYLILELCNSSLLDRLDARGTMAPIEACRVMADVARAVSRAHEAGVVHRDLKPANILISPEGEPLVTDFGIGTTLAGGPAGQTTSVGFTPGYVAPETLNGQRPEAPADVYALGATLFQLIKGKAPFVDTLEDGGNLLALASRVVGEPVPDLRPAGVPDGVCTVIEAAMAKEPADRPSAGELAEVLSAVAAGRPPLVPSAGDNRPPTFADHRPPPPDSARTPSNSPVTGGRPSNRPASSSSASPDPAAPGGSVPGPAYSGSGADAHGLAIPDPAGPPQSGPRPAAQAPAMPDPGPGRPVQPPPPGPASRPAAASPLPAAPPWSATPSPPSPQSPPPPQFPAPSASPSPARSPAPSVPGHPSGHPSGQPPAPPAANPPVGSPYGLQPVAGAPHQHPGAPRMPVPPVPPAPGGPPPPPGAVGPAPSSGANRSRLPWVLGGVVGLLILLLVAAAIIDGSDSPSFDDDDFTGTREPDPLVEPEPGPGPDEPDPNEDVAPGSAAQPDISPAPINDLAPPARYEGDAAPTCTGTADGVLSIGGLLPMTGDIGFLGRPMDIGALVAVEEINRAGGVLGQPVEYVLADSGSDASVAVAGAERLVAEGHDVIVGPALSSVAGEVIGPITGACRVQISPSNTSTFLHEVDDEDLYFRTSPGEPLQGQALADLIGEEGGGSVHLIAVDDRYGGDVGNAAFDALPGPARIDFFPSGTSDFAPWIELVLDEDADVIVLIGFGEVEELLRQLFAAGVTPDAKRILLADGSVGDALGAAFAPGELAGVRGTVQGAEVTGPFLDAMLGVDPELVDIDFGPEVYDAVIVAALAAEVAGTDEPSAVARQVNGVTVEGEKCYGFAQCRNLIAAGRNIDYDGQSGPLSFDRDGEPRQAQYAVVSYGPDSTEIDRDSTVFRLVSRQ